MISRRATSLSAFLTLATLATATPAQPVPEPPPPGSDTPPPSGDAAAPADAKAQAEQRFFKGLGLFREGAWDVALAEFLESRRLHPTRAATRNAALCLRSLRRYDEAIELFDRLLMEFGSAMSADERDAAQRERAEVASFVGTVDIRASEAGATVLVDGRARGTTPLGPLRVASGSRKIQVHKEGYVLFATDLEIAGGKSAVVDARLRPLGMSGRLRVVEATGKSVDVRVDGVVVGQTPWEGALEVGGHVVTLAGEGALGSQPASAPVRLGDVTRLSLVLEPLRGSLAVAPSPAFATVAVDGVTLGRGRWRGRVREGAHRVEIAAEGFVPVVRNVVVAPGGAQDVRVELTRDRNSALWSAANQPRFVVGLDGGLVVGPTLGGDVARDGCDGSCSAAAATGGHLRLFGGYRTSSRILLGLELGYLGTSQSVTGRRATLKERPDALRSDAGTVDDAVSLTGMTLGASAGLHLGSQPSLLLRLGAGLAVATARDARTGRFDDTGGSFATPTLAESSGVRLLYASPEVALGWRLGEHLELGAGVRATVLAPLETVRWSNERDVVTPSFLGFYDEESILAKAIVLFVPSVGARVEF